MQNYRLKTNSTRTSFVLQKTSLFTNPPKPQPLKIKQTRQTSQVGTDSYQRSLRRAFARAKLLAFFNPDLTHFITFTYKHNMLDEQQALYDIKQFLKKEKRKQKQKQRLVSSEKQSNNAKNQQSELSTFPSPHNNNKLTDVIKRKEIRKNRHRRGCGNVDNSVTLGITYAELGSVFEAGQGKEEKPFKYIYVFERQKRGAIHVHMVCNDVFEYQINNNGYKELKNWSHGFTSVLTIDNFDNNFKPYLYLFKYMEKAQRVGKSFIHTSRKSFDEIKWVDYDYYIEELSKGDIVYEEDYKFQFNQKDYTISKEYFRKKT